VTHIPAGDDELRLALESENEATDEEKEKRKKEVKKWRVSRFWDVLSTWISRNR
jgi:hypothetical protein